MLWFYDKIPDKKTEEPTEILARKVSLPLMSNNEINQLLTISIEKVLIKNEKELTMTFLGDITL